MTRTVEVEVTSRGFVTVEARTAREAARMAARGPAGWLGPLEAGEIVQTEVLGVEPLDTGETDPMTAWRERQP